MGYAYKSRRSSSAAHRYSRNRSSGRRNNRSVAKHGQYIDPARFVKEATITEQTKFEPMHKFSDFALNDLLQRNLQIKGYVDPSPIQDQAIPVGLTGKDIIGVASTGTGKTAAFALPILQKLMADKSSAALVVAPTRELAQQIEMEMKSFAQGSTLHGTLLIGGTNMNHQIRSLNKKPQVVIGTPGRIKDHIQRGTLRLRSFNLVALDEVDRMLDMGFLPDVKEILSNLSEERQSFFFSATMDNKIRSLIEQFTNNPLTISLKPSSTSDNVHQDVVHYAGTTEKIDKLHNLLIANEVEKVILFDETKYGVERLGKELKARGFKAESIHGGKSQGQRQRALKRFKQNEVNILVATDVAARGLDVSDVTHVINYSVPKIFDDYIHRIGRAGRAGQVGYALTFIAK